MRSLSGPNRCAPLLACAVLAGLPGLPSRAEPAAALSGSGIQVETLVRSSHSWDGAPLPAYPSAPPEITILRITIPAGTELPLHLHPVINAGVLLDGRLRITTDRGQSRELAAGEGLIEVVERPHRGRSLGPGPAVIVVVYAGAAGSPLSVPVPEDAGPVED